MQTTMHTASADSHGYGFLAARQRQSARADAISDLSEQQCQVPSPEGDGL